MPNLKNKGYDRYNYMDKLKARRDVTNINNPELEKKVFAIKIMSDEYKANKQAYDLYLQQGYKNPMSFLDFIKIKSQNYTPKMHYIGPATKSIELIKAEERKRLLATLCRYNNILLYGTPNGGRDWSDDLVISAANSLLNCVTFPLSFTKVAPLTAAADYYRNFNDSKLGTVYDATSLVAHAINPKLAVAMNVAPIPFAVNDMYLKGISIDNSLDLAGGGFAIADKTIRSLLLKRLPRKMRFNMDYGIWGLGEPVAAWIERASVPRERRRLIKKGRHGFDPVSEKYRKYTYPIGVFQTAPFIVNLGENAKNIYDHATKE